MFCHLVTPNVISDDGSDCFFSYAYYVTADMNVNEWFFSNKLFK